MLIGLNGRIGAGKDTAKDRILMITEQGSQERAVLSFAAPLKESAAALLNITLAELEALKLNPEATIFVNLPPSATTGLRRQEMTGRQYLERYGTEAHRNVFGEDFWLEQALPTTLDHSNMIVIFTDCRFPNEAQRVREMGGIVVEIVGPEGRAGNGHPSDTPLSYLLIDYTVNNVTRHDNYRVLDDQLEVILTREALGV